MYFVCVKKVSVSSFTPDIAVRYPSTRLAHCTKRSVPTFILNHMSLKFSRQAYHVLRHYRKIMLVPMKASMAQAREIRNILLIRYRLMVYHN